MAEQSIPTRDRDDERGRAEGGEPRARDVGRTSGGGSLGHDQPADVEEQTNTRNRGTDPVMPDDASTLNTKI